MVFRLADLKSVSDLILVQQYSTPLVENLVFGLHWQVSFGRVLPLRQFVIVSLLDLLVYLAIRVLDDETL